MLALVWPRDLARVWLIALLVLTAFFLLQALLEWKARVEAALQESSHSRSPAPLPAPEKPAIDEESIRPEQMTS